MFIDGADAALIKEGENVTFINWGNLRYVAMNTGTSRFLISVV